MRRPKKFDPQQFYRAVMVVSKMRAKQAIKDQIKARGEKISDYYAAQISELADAYLAEHRVDLVAKAVADCLTFPDFAPFTSANVTSAAQILDQLKSRTSAVQKLGAEVGANQ